jgi:CshA-type fibril repeat protein
VPTDETVGDVHAVRAAGLTLILALAATTGLGGQAALADASQTIPLPAAPAPGALVSTGTGVAAQAVTLPVPTAGHDFLVDADGNLVDTLAIDGVGSYALDENAVLTFLPSLGYVGQHGVLFREIDSYGQTGDGTYTPQVSLPAAPAAAPVVSTGTGTAVQSATVTVPGQGNAVLLDTAGAATTSTVLPAVGEFRIEPATGAVSFAPVFGYMGTASIGYRVTDAYGQATSGTYTPTVAPPAAPIAQPTSTRALANVQQVARLHVPVGTTLSLLTPTGAVSAHVYLPGQGNYAVDAATSTITFTPGQGFYGIGSLTYQLTDAYGQVARNAYTPTVLRPSVTLARLVVAKKAVAKAVVTKRAADVKHAATVASGAVLLPPVVLTAPERVAVAPARVAVPHPAHAKAHRVRVTVRVQRREPQAPAPSVAAPPSTTDPAASVVVQQLVAASTVSNITHSNGKMAGLALIVVNSLVGIAALTLNRRRHSS